MNNFVPRGMTALRGQGEIIFILALRARGATPLRARAKITSHFRIPSSCHLGPIFTRTILNVGFATPAVVLPQIAPIWHKAGSEFLEVIFARTLSH